MTNLAATAGKAPVEAASPWLTGRRALILLACYFSLQAVFRALVSNSAELDESEQLLWAQSWSWGYGSDPPLYTWLQILAFHGFGIHIFALSFLKNVLLFSAFLFTYLSAKQITGDDRVSAVAMLSLLLFPQITWESQRDLTHSVLATAVAAATFYFLARLPKAKGPWDYLGLGLCLGLGTLSKYSYCLFALALVLAALTVPTFRSALLDKRVLLTLAAALLLTAFHFRWILLSPEAAFSRPEELVRDRAQGLFKAWGLGLFSVVKCAVMLSGVLGLVYWSAFFRRAQLEPDRDFPEYRQLLSRSILAVLLMCLVAIAAVRVELRDRWFQPVVFLGAISAALWIRPNLAPESEKRFLCWVGSVGLIVLLVLPVIPVVAAITRRPTRLNAPYASLSRQLKTTLPLPRVIVAGTRLTGGNLRLFFPKSTVLAPEFSTLPVSKDTPCLVVWDGTKSPEPSPALARLVMKLRGKSLAEMKPAYAEAPFQYTRRKTMKLGYIVLR